MIRAVEQLRNLPKSIVDNNIERNRLSHFLLLTIGYSPDRSIEEIVKDFPVGDDSFIKMSQEIQSQLGKYFMDELYVDRLEREKIEGYIPVKRPIILYGHSGVGKTVLVKKVCENITKKNIAEAVYFDFKAIGDSFYKITGQGFAGNFRDVVYHYLAYEFIEKEPENRVRQWVKYKVLEDTRYLRVKDLILDKWRRPLDGDEWLELLDDPQVQKESEYIDRKPDLDVLLKFIKTFQPIVLCFDNADRFAFSEQQIVFDSCIHLSNSAEIPIIITLRTANLRRITKEGANGDLYFLDRLGTLPAETFEIDKIKTKETDNVNESLRTLLHKRFNFIRTNKTYTEVGKYYRDLIGRETWLRGPNQYIKRFWEIFNQIGKTFAEEDIYRYCNYNIREIAVLYFNFIDKLIVEPEEKYSFEKLFPENSEADITNLRNYFYKWLLCSGDLTPEKTSNNLNIFEKTKRRSPMLFMRILSYLYKNQGGHDGMPFGKIADDLWVFGIDKAELRDAIRQMGHDQHFNERTHIWIDYSEDDSSKEVIRDETKILIMPAGRYFVDKLSTSRDYVFWTLLITDFDETEFDQIFERRTIDYSATYSDGYKTSVVFNFLEKKLIPEFINSINQFNPAFQADMDEDMSNLGFYKKVFSVHNKCYLERLVDSVLKSISYTSMDSSQKKEMSERYMMLQKKLKQLETEVTKVS